jgi:outer membrane protein OmpA-like peptidoglycan-associated protein
VWLLLLGILLSLFASAAYAEPPDAQTFAPPAGEAVAFATPDAELLPHLSFSAALSSSYARRPLIRRVDCDSASDPSCVAAGGETPVVRDLVQSEAALALGLFDVAQLGVVAPLVWSNVADDFDQPSRLDSGAGLGDLRVDLDAALLHGELAAALRLVSSLPTGDVERARGSSGATFTPSLVVRQRWDSVSLAASLGYRVQERARVLETQHDDSLDALLGFGVELSRALELRAEARGRFGTTSWVEALVGAAIVPAEGFSVLAGLGGAVPPSDVGDGAAALRAYLAARYTFAGARAPVSDDVDHDGVPNSRDACAVLPEDRDGVLDDDGCPDLDDDADGLRDDVDRCPRQSEDRDGFEDTDGCPELDNDGDGQPDGGDACSMDPEDRDGFEDGDGCPEPGPKAVTISIEEGRILVSERIYFEDDRDVLRAVSFPSLDRIAEAIESLPEGRVVRVEGHTDDSGNAAYDLDISYRRARAVVEYLKGRGVPAERLKYRGYGATRPVAKGATPDVRALNRRVELALE